MGWGGWSSVLRRLVIPSNARKTDPRVVISNDDPLLAFFNHAGITYYWDDGRGFVTAVERSGEGPTAWGQWRLSAVVAGAAVQDLTQLIEISIDPEDPEGDGVWIGAGTRDDHTASVSMQGRTLSLGSDFTSDESFTDVRMFSYSMARGIRGRAQAVADSAAIGATTTVLSIPNMVFRVDRAYRISFGMLTQGSVANSLAHYRLSGLAAAVDYGRFPLPVAGQFYNTSGEAYVRNWLNNDVTATVNLTVAASAGTVIMGGAPWSPRFLQIEDCGHGQDFPGVPQV